jgi:dTDP-4-dehydrorhamnose reductase
MMKYLVIGASGQVGEKIFCELQKRGRQAFGTYLPGEKKPENNNISEQWFSVDITNEIILNKLFIQIRPDVVFLPAALTNVEFCEEHPQDSYRINVIGASNVFREASRISSKIIYFSSDYIFDGENGPYSENDLPNPLSVYGLHKLISEHTLFKSNVNNYLIVRTTVVYSWDRTGKNFVQNLIRQNKEEKICRVPRDQMGNPTYAPSLASAVIDLIDHNATGIYNVVGKERISRFDFALEVANIFNLNKEYIQPVETLTLGQKAHRPLQAGLVTNKFSEALGYSLPGYKEGLRIMASEK